MEDKRKDGVEQLHNGALRKNPYKVPNGYFDDFPMQLQERIHQQEHRNVPSWLSFMHLIKPQVTIALGVAIFAIISVTTVHYLINNQQSQQIMPMEYAKMMEGGMIESSEQHFIDILLEEEQSAKQEKLEQEAYINYLVDEGIDYGTLMDEF